MAYEAKEPIVLAKGTTATLRVMLYGLNGSGEIDIPLNKAPTIGTILLSGKKVSE